ncbi:MAG: hypothetical protein ACM3JG_11935, partial [Thiohalocapsa sp.]
DIKAAGGWGVAQGYNTLQFAGAGDNYPVRQQIRDMYKKEGKAPPKTMDNTVIYNRGLLHAAIQVEALRNAIKATGGKAPTGEDLKKGFEQIHDFTLGGLVPPMKITPQDHEGGGWVRVFKVKGNGFAPEGDWFRGSREVVMKAVKEAEKVE